MRQTNIFPHVKCSNSGQTFLVVILFILVLGLAGFSYFLYARQGETAEKFTKELSDQNKDLREAKDSVTELSQKIKTQNDSLSDQSTEISRLKADASSIKTSISDLQNNVKTDISAIKSEATKNQDALITASSRVQVQLDNLVAEIKKLKSSTPPTITPVVEVKLEPGQTATDNTNKQKAAEPAPAAPPKPEDKPAPTPAAAKPEEKPAPTPVSSVSNNTDDQAAL